MPYLTFCDKMRQFLILEIAREGGNKEKMRKCREWISLLILILSPFPHSLSISSPFPHSLSPFSLHFLIISPFSHSQAGRLAQIGQPCIIINLIALCYHCKNWIVVRNINHQWRTLSESHLLRLNYGSFQPSVVFGVITIRDILNVS